MAEPTFEAPFEGAGDSGLYFRFAHDCSNGRRWIDTIPLSGAPHGWNLVQREPLTVSPSLLCPNCGTHGFITDGRWVQA